MASTAAHDDDERTILIGSEPTSTDATDGHPAADPIAGGRIGAYRLLTLLGEGGMGQVWLAEQREPIQRKVALKLIRQQLAGSLAEAYFEIERQALARMEHPAIAKVFDAGRTAEGYPWFAMELVDGQPLDAWCRDHAPDLRTRIELLIALAFGVQHAHQRGIIHRDVKPSNVLVAEVDGRAQPRLIDFGIATGVDSGHGASARSSYERVGSGFYMSPEQYAGDGNLDIRTDVYSLGIVLLAILLPAPGLAALHGLDATTSTPHQRVTASLDAAGREAALNGIPWALRHIIAKATHPQREQRYASAMALAEDLQRYLDNQVVLAAPNSRRYRLRTFVQRRRRLLVMAGAAMLALVIGLTVAIWGLLHAERQARRSQATSDFMATVLSGIDPDLAAELDKTLMRKVLDQAATRANEELADQPDALAEIQGVISDSYSALGEATQTFAHARQAYELSLAQYGADDERTVNRARALGRAQVDAGQVREAIPFLRQTIERSTRVLGAGSRTTLLTEQALGWALREDAQYEEALALMTSVADRTDAELGADSLDTIDSRYTQAVLLADLDRHDEAIPLLHEQIRRRSQLTGPDHARVLNMRNSLAVFYLQARRFAEAEPELKAVIPLMERVYGVDSSYTLTSVGNLGGALRQQGKIEESGPYYARAADGSLAKFGPEHPRTIMTRHNYANYLLDAGQVDLSYALQTAALASARTTLGEQHPQTGSALRGVGRAALRLGRYEEAETALLDALALQERVHGSRNTQLIQTRESLVELYEAWGQPERAEPYREPAAGSSGN